MDISLVILYFSACLWHKRHNSSGWTDNIVFKRSGDNERNGVFTQSDAIFSSASNFYKQLQEITSKTLNMKFDAEKLK